MAEIFANGNNLGTVTSAFYTNSGAIRIKNGTRYLDRNITITPQNQPATPVKIRLYLSKAEFDLLDADPSSGISAIGDLKILKNDDPCSAAIVNGTLLVNPAYAEAHGSNGYMLQADISSFSSFYFGASNITLPVTLLTFTGSLEGTGTKLAWQTAHEINTSQFIVERSIDGANFSAIGTVAASGTVSINKFYDFSDGDALHQSSPLLYYRLKMMDRDGGYSYSKVITISISFVTGTVTVFPNPAADKATIVMSAMNDGKATWKIVDNAGRNLLHSSTILKKGANTVSVDIGKLPAGIYYLVVSGAGIDQKVKLQKL
jgi:hypothetical protein